MVWPCKQNATKKRLSKQTFLLKLKGSDELDAHEQDGLIMLIILILFVWYFVQAQSRLCWLTKRNGFNL